MPEINFDIIRPLIAASGQEGGWMKVTFRCPVAGTAFEASAALQAADDVGSKITSGIKQGFMWSLRSTFANVVRGAVGGGMAGSVASSATYSATSNVGSERGYSEKEKTAAITEAFESVKSNFVWDAAGSRFISAAAAGEVLTGFMLQLSQHPIAHPYDRSVLARMLTELAGADGDLGDAERGFLSGFLTPDLGTVDDLARMQPLSRAELAETSQGPTRETMLMLAWGLAFTDYQLAPQEQALLASFAAGLGLEGQQSEDLKQKAQVYIVDQALGHAYPGGRRDDGMHANIMGLAQSIGLSAADAERADIRFRKRYGL